MKLDTKAIAELIAPKLVEAIHNDEDRIVSDAGGMLIRGAVRTGFPILLREIPALTEIAVTLLVNHFGSMTGNDLLETLMTIRQNPRYQL